MKLIEVTVGTILVLFVSFDVGQACSRCSGSVSAYRRKRDVSSDQKIEAAREILQTFDDELIVKLQPDLQYLTPKEKNKFYADLQGVNIAAEAELSGVLSEFGDSLSPKELVKTVVARIMDDFADAPWLSRIRNFSGKKLENIVQEFVDKIDDK